jgi:hypothetical protein
MLFSRDDEIEKTNFLISQVPLDKSTSLFEHYTILYIFAIYGVLLNVNAVISHFSPRQFGLIRIMILIMISFPVNFQDLIKVSSKAR